MKSDHLRCCSVGCAPHVDVDYTPVLASLAPRIWSLLIAKAWRCFVARSPSRGYLAPFRLAFGVFGIGPFQSEKSHLTMKSDHLRGYLAALLSLLVVGATGCSLEPESRVLPRLQEIPNRTEQSSPFEDSLGEDAFFLDFDGADRRVSACERVRQLAQDTSYATTFQSFEALSLGDPNAMSVPKLVRHSELRKAMDRVLGKDEENPSVAFQSVFGRVHLTKNPLHGLALQMGAKIPSREEFLDLVDAELKSSILTLPFSILPIFRLQNLLKTNVVDAIRERNRIVEDRIEENFPGVFGSEMAPLLETLPNVWIENAVLDLGRSRILPGDSTETWKYKVKTLSDVFWAYTQPLAQFGSGDGNAWSWPEQFRDSRHSWDAFLVGMNSFDSRERVCAQVLAQRQFAQLIWFKGWSLFPHKEAQASQLAPLSQLLDSPSGTQFRLCPKPGVLHDGFDRILLGESELSNFDDAEGLYGLSRNPRFDNSCTVEEASRAKMGAPLGPARSPLGEGAVSADALDWASFLGVLGNTVVVLNPAAPWWQNRGLYPLANFSSLEQARDQGAWIPAQTHALALAMLNMGFSTFYRRHLVFVDENFRQVKAEQGFDASQIVGMRISQEPRIHQRGQYSMETSIDTATTVTELALRLSNALHRLEVWNDQAKAWTQNSGDAEVWAREHADLLRGLFGSEQNFSRLELTGPGSIQERLQAFRTASVLLLMRFSEWNAATNSWDCRPNLKTDLSLGTEHLEGTCTSEQEQSWRRVLRLAAVRFSSPHLKELAKAR